MFTLASEMLWGGSGEGSLGQHTDPPHLRPPQLAGPPASSPRKESPKGKDPVVALRCSGRNGAGMAPLLDPSPLVAQFNREMLQVRPAGVPAQGAAWGAGGGGGDGTVSLSCELWGGVRGGEG